MTRELCSLEPLDPEVVHEFLFATAPLYVERASGAPVNPVVVKATAGDCDGDKNGNDERRDGDGGGRNGDGG